MKKISVLSMIFALIAFVLVTFGTAGLLGLSRNNATDSELYKTYVMYGCLFAVLMIITFVLVVAKKNKPILFVMLAFAATGIYFVKKLCSGYDFNKAIFDVVSPVDNYNVLTLLLFIGFVVCAILYLFKGVKYTNYFVIGYLILLVLPTIKFLPEFISQSNMADLVSLTFGMISGYVSFIGFFLENKKEEKQVENLQ